MRHRHGTGVPGAERFLKPGEKMTASIEGIGPITMNVVAEAPPPAGTDDFDAVTGAIENRRTFATVDPASGSFPDGITVDADGCLWCAQPVFGRLVRYDPIGRIERIIELPVSRGMSVMFGGADLATLYITTMRTTLDERQLSEEPGAGSLLAITPGVTGIAETPFAG